MNLNFEKDDTTSSNHSINWEMQILKSSFLKTVNNLNALLPLDCATFFNHLSTPQLILKGLAAYISF